MNSYQELRDKLEKASQNLSEGSGTRAEIGHLIDVFSWCEEAGISLDELDIRKHLHKYRAGVADLRKWRDESSSDPQVVNEMRDKVSHQEQRPP